MRHYCTYFDRNYLVRGLTMIESLRRHDTSDFTIHVVCMDEFTRILLDRIGHPNVRTIPMHSIEARDWKLLHCRTNRTTTEYLWTTTPTVILRVLQQNPRIETLTYLDADMFFFSSVEPIFAELGNHSVLIHEHRFSPRLSHLIENGRYNVGLLCFRNDHRAVETLEWWRERCIEWCSLKAENGKMGDQGYLNDWPNRFPWTKVTKNIGVGVAPWNIEQYAISKNGTGVPSIDSVPIVLYHFHDFKFANPYVMTPCADLGYRYPAALLTHCILPYAEALLHSYEKVCSMYPDFQFGMVKTDLLTPEHTFVARRELADQIARIGAPQPYFPLNDAWNCYYSNQVLETRNGEPLAGISV